MAIPARASEAATIVTATIYTTDGRIVTDQVAVTDLLGDPDGCPVYGGSNLVDYDASGVGTRVDQPFASVEGQTGTWPLSSILACLETTHVQASTVNLVSVRGASGRFQVGRDSQLKRDDLRTQGDSDFLDPTQTPLILSRGGTFEYHRPRRASGDANGADQVQTSDAPIAIEVFTGPLLEVRVEAPSGSVEAGAAVSVQASVSGNDGSRLSYRWTSGDGQTSTDLAPTFHYSAAGTYTATLQVTTAGGGGGGDQASVTVTAAGTPPPQTTPGPSSPGPTEGSSGPAPPGTARPHDRSPGTTTGSDANRSAGGSGTTRGTTTPATQSPQVTATPAPTSGGSANGSGSSTGGGGSTPSAGGGAGRTTPATPTTTRAEKTPDTGLERVTGRLVSDVIPLSAAASPLVTETGAPRGSATAERRPVDDSSVPAVIGAALAVMALLALGAARELDVRWRTLLPRPGG